MMERGYLDSREMSNMFNLLRSNDLIWANVVNNYLLGNKPPAFDLLYWNSDGTRMARAAHSWYLRNTYRREQPDRARARSRSRASRSTSAASRRTSTRSAPRRTTSCPGTRPGASPSCPAARCASCSASSGHIAGIINPPGGKGAYWVNRATPRETPEAVAGRAPRKHEGSWWTDWARWLASGRARGEPPPLGSTKHPPLDDAPGRTSWRSSPAVVRGLGDGRRKVEPQAGRQRPYGCTCAWCAPTPCWRQRARERAARDGRPIHHQQRHAKANLVLAVSGIQAVAAHAARPAVATVPETLRCRRLQKIAPVPLAVDTNMRTPP